MTLLLGALAALALSGTLTLLAGRSPRWCNALGLIGVLAAAGLGLTAAGTALTAPAPEVFRARWEVPGGSFVLQRDPLTGFFLIPILGLSALAAVYAVPYFAGLAEHTGKSLGPVWFFFQAFVAGMTLVVVARNAVLFLIAWEAMSLAAFFLITVEDEKPAVRSAGWVFLAATHLGTACLLAMFLILGLPSGSLDFDDMAASASRLSPALTDLVFVLAVIGFGTKAGVVPFHVWLPEAHPVAPGPVSALMSGVMIKTGVFGLMLVLTFLGPPPYWWAWTLIGLGLLSGAFGILNSVAQPDLKRLLAYSSVENVGIILIGLGLGVLGRRAQVPALVVLGYGGALFHVLCHSLSKGLLFLSAAAVERATSTTRIDQLGGLLKRSPLLGGAFLTGSVAIVGLPPFGNFASEFLLYFVAFQRSQAVYDRPGPVSGIPFLLIIAGLALVGGLAAAGFAKAFGLVFLGEPRTPEGAAPRRLSPLMRGPLAAMAVGCLALGLGAPWVLEALAPTIAAASGQPADAALAGATSALRAVVGVTVGMFAVVGGLGLLRWRLLAGREVGASGTWDCGYARPTARMQYTGGSFVQPLADLFGPLLRLRRQEPEDLPYFPAAASADSQTDDLATAALYRPLFRGVTWLLLPLRGLQQGRLHLYVLYIAVTLLALFAWFLATEAG